MEKLLKDLNKEYYPLDRKHVESRQAWLLIATASFISLWIVLSGNQNGLDEFAAIDFATPAGQSIPDAKVPFHLGSRIATINSSEISGAPDGRAIGRTVTPSRGRVVLGPIDAVSGKWWKINYDAGTDGWVKESALEGVVGHEFGVSPWSDLPSEALTAWWQFDEGVNSILGDASANNRRGVSYPASGPSWQNETQCKSGKCLRFDGVDDTVSLGNINPEKSDFSISVWFRPEAARAMQVLADVGGGSGYRIYWNPNGTLAAAYYNGIAWRNVSGAGCPLNSWCHAVLSWKRDGLFSLYINGSPAGSINAAADASLAIHPVSSLFLGSDIWLPGRRFQGSVDEVRIYQKALSATEVSSLFSIFQNVMPLTRFGTSLDETPFQNALRLAPAGSIIIVPPGVYEFKKFVSGTSNASLTFSGMPGAIIRQAPGYKGRFFSLRPALQGGRITGMTFQGREVGTGTIRTTGILISSAGGSTESLRGFRFDNNLVDGWDGEFIFQGTNGATSQGRANVPEGVVAENNTFQRMGESPFTIFAARHSSFLRNVVQYDHNTAGSSGNAIQLMHFVGVPEQAPNYRVAEDIVAEGNKISVNPGVGYSGYGLGITNNNNSFQAGDVGPFRISNNTISGPFVAGISVTFANNGGGRAIGVPLTITNNVLVNTRGGITITGGKDSIQITSNVIANTSATPYGTNQPQEDAIKLRDVRGASVMGNEIKGPLWWRYGISEINSALGDQVPGINTFAGNTVGAVLRSATFNYASDPLIRLTFEEGESIPGVIRGNFSWINGRVGRAISLNRNDAYVDLGKPDFITHDGHAIATWVKPSAKGSKQTIVGYPIYTQKSQVINLELTPENKVSFGLRDDAGNEEITVSDTTIPVGEWHHIAVVRYKRFTDSAKIFIDGVEVSSKHVVSQRPLLEITSRGARYPLGVGGGSPGLPSKFLGAIDEVRIYNRPISPAEVKQLFAEGN